MSVKLTSHIPRISTEIHVRVAAATEAGAKLIEEAAKERVPVKTGALRDAIHTEFKGDADWAVVAGNRDAFYGHMVEFGTTHSPAHPFLVPAAEARRMEVQKIVAAALRHL